MLQLRAENLAFYLSRRWPPQAPMPGGLLAVVAVAIAVAPEKVNAGAMMARQISERGMRPKCVARWHWPIAVAAPPSSI